MDDGRRLFGRAADAMGLGPQETPYRIAAEWPGARLRAYHDRGVSLGPVVFIVPAPFKRPYIWDLLPDVSVVRRCRAHGARIYLLDWRRPTNETDRYGLAEYARDMPAAAVDVIEAETGIAAPVVAGNSLGGTFATIFATLCPERVRGLILLDAPLAFGGGCGPLADATKASPHAHDIRAALGSPIPGALINIMSFAVAPDVFQGQRMLDFSASLTDIRALAVHMGVERWALDEFPIPGRLFEDTVELLYRNDSLVRNTLEVAGRVTGMARLCAAVMAVVNRACRIVPPRSMLLGLRAAPAASVVDVLEYHAERGPMIQHVGPLVGPRAHALLWPIILDWMTRVADLPAGRERSTI